MNEELDSVLQRVQNLPSSKELQKLIAETETKIFIRQPKVSADLINTGWYLFSVATAKASLDLYSWPTQRVAYQLSAHIFDLVLADAEQSEEERMTLAFAAQIGYMRGELNPNAIAIYKGLGDMGKPSFYLNNDNIALRIGIMFLAQDRRNLFPILQDLRDELKELASSEGLDFLFNTRYGVDYGVITGIRHLVIFVTYGPGGNVDRLASARELFVKASSMDSRYGSITARWVAVNLINIVDDLKNNNLWDMIPPELPNSIARAMTNGEPSVFSLWPPQAKLLKATPSPLLSSTKSLLVSFPTSAGKTLMAQLFVIAHLEQQEQGVCFIVPTHSLAREVRGSLQERLRLVGMSSRVFLDADEWNDNSAGKQVDVMTPEKLANLLKNYPSRVLQKYSLFIFDEAHLIGDKNRGWIVEGTVTFLKALTQKTDHRIILMSALIGNRSHMYQWLSGEGESAEMPEALHSDWRGPRRLYAIYTSEPNWKIKKTIVRRTGKVIEEYPLHARIYLRAGMDGPVKQLGMDESVGTLQINAQTRKKEGGTPFNAQLLPFIKSLGESGPILIIETTKIKASTLALAVAETLDRSLTTQDIADFVALRLGVEHPLAKSLLKGVAFHHGALPTDVQSAIEEAVKDGDIQYIVATTTLADGVNLPVRTVLIAEQGTHTQGGEYNKFLSGPKLINAIGRAGRAGKESDGWIILAVNKPYSPDIFDELSPVMSEEYDVSSLLSTEEALEALSWYEQTRAASEDALLERASPSILDGFVGYIWFLGTAFEELNYKLNYDNLRAVLSYSLAWKQLVNEDKDKWDLLAKDAFDSFTKTPENQRRRWAKAGTSLSSAAELESIKDSLVAECAFIGEDSIDLRAIINLIIGDGRLEKIMGLKEAEDLKVSIRVNQSSSSKVTVDTKKILVDWLNGVDLRDLGEKHLSAVTKADFMFEQLSTFISTVFEHYLPWVLGTIVRWTNDELEEMGLARMLDDKIPQYVHHGVMNPVALDLFQAGMSSRRLANSVAKVYDDSSIDEQVILWLRSLDLVRCQDLFDASPLEIKELFECAREDGLVRDVLFGEGAFIEFITLKYEKNDKVILKETMIERFPGIAIYSNDEELGIIPLQYQNEVKGLLRTGIPISVLLTAEGLYITRADIE